MTVVFIPLAIILLYIEDLLLLLDQDPAISAYAQKYLKYYLPGLYLQLFNDIQRKFLNSLGKINITLISQCFGTVCHIIFNYIFVFYF